MTCDILSYPVKGKLDTFCALASDQQKQSKVLSVQGQKGDADCRSTPYGGAQDVCTLLVRPKKIWNPVHAVSLYEEEKISS